MYQLSLCILLKVKIESRLQKSVSDRRTVFYWQTLLLDL
nr:MAG TPA: hypothetical protein [Caudoviricetes sp.]